MEAVLATMHLAVKAEVVVALEDMAAQVAEDTMEVLLLLLVLYQLQALPAPEQVAAAAQVQAYMATVMEQVQELEEAELMYMAEVPMEHVV